MDSASAPAGAARGCRRRLGELADLEDLRPAVRAEALDRRAPVLHGHLPGVLDLHLLAFLDAVTLGHHEPPWGFDGVCGECEVTAFDGHRTPETYQSSQTLGMAAKRRGYREAVLTAPVSGGLAVCKPGAAGARRAAKP